MPRLTVLVGPPGSGKSTLAKEYCSKGGITYINQDSQGKGHLDLFYAAVERGDEIVVDRMGFSKEQRSRYLNPAKAKGYQTHITVLHVPYRVCLERVRARTDHETIKDEKAARSALGTFFGKYERVTDDEADKVLRIFPEGHKPLAIVCDLDGTLCKIDQRLHFVRKPPGEKKDWNGFFNGILQDEVNEWCRDILESFAGKTPLASVVYCSGRPDDRRKDTVEWLKANGLYAINRCMTTPVASDNEDLFHLYMRPRNDQRDDSIVKEIILDFEILTRFTPYFMIDDRKRVVDMWRKRGFTCLHCAEGDF